MSKNNWSEAELRDLFRTLVGRNIKNIDKPHYALKVVEVEAEHLEVLVDNAAYAYFTWNDVQHLVERGIWCIELTADEQMGIVDRGFKVSTHDVPTDMEEKYERMKAQMKTQLKNFSTTLTGTYNAGGTINCQSSPVLVQNTEKPTSDSSFAVLARKYMGLREMKYKY